MNGNVGFSYEIIRDYLLSEGGKVEYHKLIKYFKDALANPENKGKLMFYIFNLISTGISIQLVLIIFYSK